MLKFLFSEANEERAIKKRKEFNEIQLKLINKKDIPYLPYNENTIIFDTRSLISYRKNPINFDIKEFTRIHIFEDLIGRNEGYLKYYKLETADNIIIVDEGSSKVLKSSLHYKLFEDLKDFLGKLKPNIYLLKNGF